MNTFSDAALRAPHWSGLMLYALFAVALACVLIVASPALRRRLRSRWPSRAASSRSHRKATRAALKHLLTHDSLTSLPNRLLLEDRLRQAILQAERRGDRFAVMVLNLDRFKAINDSLGREAGDHLLIDVANRLMRSTREMDTIARYGSDEFVLIFTDIKEPQDAQVIASKIVATLSEPLRVGSSDIYADASIGVSMYPDDGSDVNTLLLHGDAAMSHAKKLGGRQAWLFTSRMSSWTRERLDLTNELRRSVELGQLELHYQPKAELSSGRVSGAEALLRWRHPVRGLLLPDAFLYLAEETGFIIPMSEWVLKEACRQAAQWLHSKQTQVRIAVNLSAQQFARHDLVALVREALDAAHLPARFLKLELTEGALISDPDRAAQILTQLHSMGVCISIDDFGVGCSCLSYLKRFPIDELKIDRGFVHSMVTDPADGAIVRAIVALAQGLGLKVVAEGVETPDQLEFLQQLRCDRFQGGLCSVPLPPDEFVSFMRDHRVNLNETSASAIQYRRAAGESRPFG